MHEQSYEQKTITRDIPTEFTVKYYYDSDCDYDWMGHFSSKWEYGAIDIQKSGLVNRHGRNDYQYWVPTPGGSKLSDYDKDYRTNRYGMTKHEAGISAHKHARQDFRRMAGLMNEDWHFMGIVVESAWGTEESLWGIESDSDDDSINEVIDDLVYTLTQDKTITITIR